jgi:phosphohistidine phosphatase
MKSVLLMRHAKSSWKDTKLNDHERPLNKRGKKDAPAMGKLICERELVSQLILTSSALRATETVDGVVECMGYTGKVEIVDELYLAEPADIIQCLNKVSNDVERVMLVGHNPGLESLLQIWSNQIIGMPTGTVAYVVLPVESWGDVKLNTEAEVVELWRPGDLKEEKKEVEPKGKKEEKKVEPKADKKPEKKVEKKRTKKKVSNKK